MNVTKLASLAAAAAIVLSAAPAAAQLDATNAPRSRGPVTLEDKDCKRDVQRAPGGAVMARFALCRWFYRFKPERETNENRDFGAFWIQASVDAENGWCTRWTKADMKLPDKFGMLAPKLGTERRGPQRFTTKLVVDASGDTERPARLQQTFKVFPGKMRAFKPSKDVYRLRWDGATKRKLAYAYGIEVSYPDGGNPSVVTPSILALFRRGC
ncbi:MAG TPA: hypothetical protein VHJ34_12290 [Actinomycetota bacterium]|nr:hypothetical protein [Actinomycetota bacterium]